MSTRRWPSTAGSVLALALTALTPISLSAQAAGLEPLRYTIRIPEPASKTFHVEIVVPTEKRDSVILMMAIWSPGMYTLRTTHRQVSAFTAKATDGTPLDVSRPTPSRWIVKTGGRPSITVSYTLAAPRGSNLSNGVTDSSLVIVGPATYITLVEQAHRPADVRLELPATGSPQRRRSTRRPTASQTTSSRRTTTSSPIRRFSPASTCRRPTSPSAARSTTWAYLGDAEWDAQGRGAAMTPLIEEHLRFWGSLPFKKYAFLNIITAAAAAPASST